MVDTLPDGVPDPPRPRQGDRETSSVSDDTTPDTRDIPQRPSVLILGGGFFGLSTAWHLARAGYKDVTVLDRSSIPSSFADDEDTNKIVRAQSMYLPFSNLGNEAIDAWEQQPPFATNNLFHRTGWLLSVRESSPHVKNIISTAIANNDQYPSRAGSAVRIDGPEDLKRVLPHFVTLNKPGATAAGIYSFDGGWVEAKRSMEVLARETEKMGVRFVCGESGTVRALVREHELTGASPTSGNSTVNTSQVGNVNGGPPQAVMPTPQNAPHSADPQRVVGVVTEDGSRHTADKVIMALGDFSENLIDFGGQLVQIMYVRCFLQLKPEQAKLYHSLPIIETTEQGHIFPPDEQGILKVCSDNFDIHVRASAKPENKSHTSSAAGGVNGTHGWLDGSSSDAASGKMSQSAASASETRQEDIQPALDVVRNFLPGLADCEVTSSEVVYENECFDCELILAPHPSSPSSLVIASAGTGHAFKFFPVIGKYVRQCLEGTLAEELRQRWRWRPDAVPPEDELADLREPPPQPQPAPP